MNLYIENLLPRLRQYGQDIDRKELFIEIPWITIDKDQKQHKYIFKRNGELIMSSNGQVNIGTWEYLSTSKSLLIDRNVDKILLKHYFVDYAVMVLRLDGDTNNKFILANELIIPDFNIEDHFREIYYKRHNIKPIKLKDGTFLEMLNYQGSETDVQVTIDGENVPDGIFDAETYYPKKYQIRNSFIARVLEDKEYMTDKGVLSVEQKQFHSPYLGDTVMMNGEPAPNGKYKIGFLKYLYIKDGKISSKKLCDGF